MATDTGISTTPAARPSTFVPDPNVSAGTDAGLGSTPAARTDTFDPVPAPAGPTTPSAPAAGTLVVVGSDGGVGGPGGTPLSTAATINSPRFTAVGIGTAALSQGLRVSGNLAGALCSFNSSANGHALTVIYSGTSGATQAAINIVSSNPAFSASEITGVETGHGTLKIAHVGYNDQSDANAAAVSIDLQTSNAGTGTAAQAIFITSTTDTNSTTLGNAFNARLNGLDWFKVIGANNVGVGVVGVGVAVGHAPSGMVEIAQKDTSVIGLFMQAASGGADLVQLKDSGGTLRFQVSNAGATVIRGTGFFSGNAIVGATSGDFGGAGSALTVCHSTDPSTNPSAGHVIIYTDAAGNLSARTSAGNVRIIAAV